MADGKYLTIVVTLLVILLSILGCLQTTSEKEISTLKERIMSMNATIIAQRNIIETQRETIENYKKMIVKLREKIIQLNESITTISQIKKIECGEKKNVTIIQEKPSECEELFDRKPTRSLIIALSDEEVKEDFEEWDKYYFDFVIISKVKNLERFQRIDQKIHKEVWNVTIHAIPKKWKEIYKNKTYMIYVDIERGKVLDKEER
ncbi:MAG: hypothetical protein ACE5K4_10225 [Candidatus Hydrothermarchaeota archaeon]